MNKLIVGGVAVVLALAAGAIAFAAMDEDGGTDNQSVSSPTVPAQDEPMPVDDPNFSIGGPTDEPMPVDDPRFPIGGPTDEPMPVDDPQFPIGGPTDEPMPVDDPKFPIGGPTGPSEPDSDQPIPSEPIIPVTPADPAPSLPAGRYAEEAPIDGLDVLVAESFPPQYIVNIQAGLPSGCAEQYMHNVSRDGNVVTIEVLNSFPEGDPICTAIYGMYELNVNLGSDFTSGEMYTVSVNDQETTFTAQ